MRDGQASFSTSRKGAPAGSELCSRSFSAPWRAASTYDDKIKNCGRTEPHSKSLTCGIPRWHQPDVRQSIAVLRFPASGASLAAAAVERTLDVVESSLVVDSAGAVDGRYIEFQWDEVK